MVGDEEGEHMDQWTESCGPVHSSIAVCVDALVPRELNPQGTCHFWEGLNCCVMIVLFSSDFLTFGPRTFDGNFVRVCSVSAQSSSVAGCRVHNRPL